MGTSHQAHGPTIKFMAVRSKRRSARPAARFVVVPRAVDLRPPWLLFLSCGCSARRSAWIPDFGFAPCVVVKVFLCLRSVTCFTCVESPGPWFSLSAWWWLARLWSHLWWERASRGDVWNAPSIGWLGTSFIYWKHRGIYFTCGTS